MSKFPERLYCNQDADGGAVFAYLDMETAAAAEPIRVGIYQLVEVVEARAVTTVETVKVEN